MALKDFLRSQAYDSRLARLLTARAARLGTPVFMFHHTLPPGSECFDAGMDTTSTLFDNLIAWLKQRFHIVSLTAIAEMVSDGKVAPDVCALTIDDGWRDTYEHAFPILRRHAVPATIFLPFDYIGTDRQFWQDAYWDLYRQLEAGNGWRELNDAAEAQFPWWPRLTWQQTFSGVLERLFERPMSDAEELIRWASATFGLRSRLRTPAFMSWDQVREMRDHGFSFGSHTNSHVHLTRVSRDAAREEIRSSKERLEAALGGIVDTFCYPAGRHDPVLAELVRQAGYRVAVTDQPRLVTRRDSLWMLPRVGVSSLTLSSHHSFHENAITLQLARAGVRARLRPAAAALQNWK